jgi:legumain
MMMVHRAFIVLALVFVNFRIAGALFPARTLRHSQPHPIRVASSPPSEAPGQQFAVLVAGSNTYYNYRHQADVCHAYNILIKSGVPAQNIITMFYDDIANNPLNPLKGTLFNRPGTPGVDVYHECRATYSGEQVTPKNFLGVLTGNATATGGLPVLKTTSKDRIFVFFSDHGASG